MASVPLSQKHLLSEAGDTLNVISISLCILFTELHSHQRVLESDVYPSVKGMIRI